MTGAKKKTSETTTLDADWCEGFLMKGRYGGEPEDSIGEFFSPANKTIEGSRRTITPDLRSPPVAHTVWWDHSDILLSSDIHIPGMSGELDNVLLWPSATQAPRVMLAARSVPPEILDQLHSVQDEARDEGYPAPSDEAVERAKKILRRVYQIAPQPYTIYPGERGEIVIDARRSPAGAFVLLCHETETWGIATVRDTPFRTWFREWGEPSEGFVKATIAALSATGRVP